MSDSRTSPEIANLGAMSFRYSNKLFKSVSLLLLGQYTPKLEQFKGLPCAAANLNCNMADSRTSPEMANLGRMSFRYSNKLLKSVSLLPVGQFVANLDEFKE